MTQPLDPPSPSLPRIAAPRWPDLPDTPSDEGLDRLTRMAARLLGAPIALITLIAEDRQLFKSATGLAEPWASRRAAPLSHSFCRHVVSSGEPLVVEDARRHPLLRANPAVRDFGWIGYAGVPLVVGGQVVGALSVIDAMPRLWSERDLSLLADLAACAASEIALRAAAPDRPAERRPGHGNGGPQYPDVFEEAGIAFGVASPEGRWVRVNHALRELLGYAEDELLGAPTEKLTHPDDRPAEREALRLLLAGECASYTQEKRCLGHAGEPVWTLATVTLVRDAEQRPHHFVIGFQEIGDRVRAEAALRESEERNRLVVEAARHAAWDWDLASDRIVWSGAIAELFGQTPPGFASTAAWWYQRIHAEDRERVVAEIQAALASGERTWELAYRFRRGDGSYAEVASRGTVLVESSGEPARMIGTMADESARRETEAALRASEARYRSLVDQLREVVFQVDGARRWLLLNPAWTELTGVEAAAAVGRAAAESFHPDDRTAVEAGIGALLGGELGLWEQELRCRTRGGGHRWVEVRARPAVGGAGAGASGTLTDITDRKREESLTQGQSALLARIASSEPLPALLHAIVEYVERHADGIMATVMLLDLERGELRLGAGPSLPEVYRRSIASVPVGPASGTCGTAAHRGMPVISPDLAAEPLWEGVPQRELALAAGLRACWSVPVFSTEGAVLGTLALYAPEARDPRPEEQAIVAIASYLAGIAIDRSRTIEALGRSSRLLQQVLDSLPVGVWVVGTDGRIVFANPASRRLWGDEPHAERAWLVHGGRPVSAEESAASRALRGETLRDELVRLDLPDGTVRLVMTSAVPVVGAAGEIGGAIVLHRDVTEQQAAEDALRRSEEQLRQAQKMEAVGQLAGGIAHDFNNLLTGILSYCDLLLDEVRAGDPIRGDVEQIRQAGQRAAGLTRQLLAFSRRQVLQPKVISLNSVLAELDGMVRRLAGADVVVEAEIDPGLWYVLADPGQLEQVVINLVVNARDAMPDGGRLTITTANRIYLPDTPERPAGVRPGAYVTLSLSDTGVGMELELQSRVFEPFFTTKEPGKGTGLGLSTVYGIVQQSGGHVALRSAPGQGATFTVLLPRHTGSQEAAAARVDRRRLPGGTETLLLVEDEAAVRSSARRLLERNGYTVLEARHGGDALRIAEETERPIDLVLTDLVMPEMGGRELVERLRSHRPGLRVVFMSGYTEKAIAVNGVMPPHTGFVEKPFTVEQLMRRVREILDG
jgi:PAS domain S-box-containing protein